MHFDFTPEQRELGSLVRRFLADTSPESEVRRVMDAEGGCDLALWRRMGRELGVQGLPVPEAYGGLGLGLVEVGAVAQELGRTLACVPFLSGVLATLTLLRADDEQARKRYLPDLVTGDLVATLALTEEDAGWDPPDVTTRARRTPGGWSLDGTKMFILDGHLADLLLVVARTPDGIDLFCVDGRAPGVTRQPLDTLDRTRPQARIDLADAPAAALAVRGGATPLVRGVLDAAAAVLAAEQVGVAERALQLSVEFVKVRHQFGRPIGSFQAIKHQLADVLLEVESARMAAHQALLELQPGADPSGEPDEDRRAAAASLAKAFCSEACLASTQRMIQVHGGIGFTWEHPAHLYFKRASTSAQLFGDPAHHRERLARAIGL